MTLLKNRHSAGKDLAKKLKKSNWKNPLILALPRGGVPVAAELSKELHVPWDILLVKKITPPHHSEFAVGAIAETDDPIWNWEHTSALHLSPEELESMAAKTHKRIYEQTQKWRRKVYEFIDVANRTVILVDDGLATGLTMHAAVKFVKRRGAKEIIIAVPVSSREAVASFEDAVDHVVALHAPEQFSSVGQWYEDFTQTTDDEVTELLTARHIKRNAFLQPEATDETDDAVRVLKKIARPLDYDNDIDGLLRRISHARVVMLGEASHGTEEFYEWRKIISQKLIKDYGYKFIAVEGDWPDCYRLNKYIHGKSGKNTAREVMRGFSRWPTWMWGNHQVAELVEWMKGRRAGFYGLDVYSLYDSLDIIKKYANKLDPMTQSSIMDAFDCFESFNHNELAYAKTVGKWPGDCEDEIRRSLADILKLRKEETDLHDEELFDIQQNAKIIRNADRYYHAMMFGGANSWNVRDEHMMDSLDALLEYHGEGAKAIVWAHNTHIGDYRATDMVDAGYVNIGGLARERYGADNVALVGFGTYEGEVLAGKAWDKRPEIMKVPKANDDSYEKAFHEASQSIGAEEFYVVMNKEEELSVRKGHRAIGVVYQTAFEAQGHNYVPTELAKRYDAFLFIDKTTALRSVITSSAQGVIPETWPTGL